MEMQSCGSSQVGAGAFAPTTSWLSHAVSSWLQVELDMSYVTADVYDKDIEDWILNRWQLLRQL